MWLAPSPYLHGLDPHTAHLAKKSKAQGGEAIQVKNDWPGIKVFIISLKSRSQATSLQGSLLWVRLQGTEIPLSKFICFHCLFLVSSTEKRYSANRNNSRSTLGIKAISFLKS